MKVVAVTGGFATGKSTVTRMLQNFGAPLFDMDRAGHWVLENNKNIIAKIAKRFPDVVTNGKVDRAKLGNVVFKHPGELRWLETQIHPEIFKLQDAFVKKARHAGKRFVIVEIPLLFEIKAEEKYDFIILVSTSPFQQKRRALKRPHMTEKKLEDILSRQFPVHIKRKKSDKEIFTGLGRADTMFQTRKLWHELTRHS